jgi:hypothetical protein
VQGLEHVDELVAQTVLEGDPARVDPTRHEEHLLVLDVDALDRSDAAGEVEDLGLGEGLGGEPALVLLPDDRRVEALLDRRPDGERRARSRSPRRPGRTVTDPELVDLAEVSSAA